MDEGSMGNVGKNTPNGEMISGKPLNRYHGRISYLESAWKGQL
jgi:hypothetical protein